MRILYVAESFGSGVFEIARLLAGRLAQRGHVTAIAYGQVPETPPDVRGAVGDGVELFPMPWRRRTIGAHLAACRRLRGLVGEFRPDAVHLMSSFAGLAGAIAVPRGVPTLYTPQAYSFNMRRGRAQIVALKAVERFVARRCTLIAACSHHEAQLARQVARARRVEVLENGIAELDDGALPPPPERPSPRAVAMGRIGPQHQPEGGARILAAVADAAEVAWIGGDPPGRTGEAALEAAGVAVTGWVDRKRAVEELGRSTAYLHWTAWDGLPLSILEAMARDVAVIASDIGPNREVLGDEQVTGSEQEAITLLRRALTDPQAREAMIERQRGRRERYGAERMVDRALELYSGVAAAAAGSPAASR